MKLEDRDAMWWKLLLITAIVVAGVAALSSIPYQRAWREAETAADGVAARAGPVSHTFEPAMVSGLPEIAKRYFNHAIAIGTPLYTTVHIEMEGTFLLGNKVSFQS